MVKALLWGRDRGWIFEAKAEARQRQLRLRRDRARGRDVETEARQSGAEARPRSRQDKPKHLNPIISITTVLHPCKKWLKSNTLVLVAVLVNSNYPTNVIVKQQWHKVGNFETEPRQMQSQAEPKIMSPSRGGKSEAEPSWGRWSPRQSQGETGWKTVDLEPRQLPLGLQCESKKSPRFVTFFLNGWEFLNQILRAYYALLVSTLDYEILFNYLQLWWSYAILSVTTQFTSCAQIVRHRPKCMLAFSDIFSKQLGIFSPNFTSLLNVHMHARVQFFI